MGRTLMDYRTSAEEQIDVIRETVGSGTGGVNRGLYDLAPKPPATTAYILESDGRPVMKSKETASSERRLSRVPTHST